MFIQVESSSTTSSIDAATDDQAVRSLHEIMYRSFIVEFCYFFLCVIGFFYSRFLRSEKEIAEVEFERANLQLTKLKQEASISLVISCMGL